MTRIRRGPLPSDHFTIISNTWLRDEALPWAARGLLGWLASHADGFDITEDAIVAAGPSGRDAVRTMIYALEEAGYLLRVRTPITSGGSTVDYLLTEPGAAENPPFGSGGKPDPRLNQGEQGVSAGEPNDGKSDPRSYPEDQKKTKTTTSSNRVERSTRIPKDFMPDEKMREWFAAEKLSLVIDGRREHEKFVDYWLGCPGARGRKTDWPATWRNWMRTAAERAGRRPGTALAPVSGAPYSTTSKTNQRVAEGMALVAKFEQMEASK